MGYIKIPNKWMNEVDTGFGNRIPYWNLAYYLSRKHDFEFTILVDFYQWKEIMFVDFPNTEPLYFRKGAIEEGSGAPFVSSSGNFRDNSFLNDFIPLISTDDLNNIVLDKNKNYFLTGHWPPSPYDHYDPVSNTTIEECDTKLKLKSSILEGIIKDTVKDVIGIHLRSQNGTDDPLIKTKFDQHINFESTDEINTPNLSKICSEKNKTFYISTNIADTSSSLRVGDTKQMLDLFPNYDIDNRTKKIYLQYNCIDYRTIFDKMNIFQLDTESMENKYFQIPDLKTFKDVIDLYSLIYCEKFVGGSSTWSDFVTRARG